LPNTHITRSAFVCQGSGGGGGRTSILPAADTTLPVVCSGQRATVEGKLAPPAYGALYRVYIGYNSAAAAGWAYTDALLCLNVANWQQRRCGLNASFYERRRRRLLLSEFVQRR